MTVPIDPLEGLTADEKRRRLGDALRRRLTGASRTLPLSPGQRALWLLNQLAPDTAAHNIGFTARIVSRLDPDVLRRAFQALVDRHAILRAAFPAEAGEPAQRIEAARAVPFEHVDASRWSLAEVHDDVGREINRPFDLQRGPVLRVRLWTRSPQESFLSLTVHHIALDGWSLWICLSELRDLYAGLARGHEPSLPPPSDYGVYLQAQADATGGAEGVRHREFWRERLGEGAQGLDLPGDRIRPPVPAFRGASHRFRLSGDVTERLRALSRSVRGTLQMGVLTLFEALLHRYTGQDEVTVGYLASGRSRVSLQSLVGYVANALALGSRMGPHTTFRDALKTTRDSLLDALDHEEYPFSAVVDEIAPDRDPSRTPLFQALFVFEKPHLLEDQPLASFMLGEPRARMVLGDLVLESLPFSIQREGQFDLTLVAAEMDGELSLALDYSADLFDASTIRRMAEHLQLLAAGAAANPDQPIATLPMLTGTERAVVARLGAPNGGVPDLCFHELFERRAAERPDAIAVVCDDASVTYAEVNARANRLARHLRELGVRSETTVGVSVERSPDLAVAVLAILKAGGAFLPLDPAYPPDRLAFMIADAGIPVLVTQRSLVDRLPPFGGRVVEIDARDDSAFDASNLEAAVAPSNLAYLIYTSGSTGRPKGAMLEHRGLVNVALEQQRRFGTGPRSRVLQFAALSFDASVFELAMAFGSGGTLCVAPPAALLPGLPLLETIRRHRVSVVTLPPSALLNLPAADLPCLETITVAGEACPAELVARWADGRAFFNLYGPTEATIWTTVARCEDPGRQPSIGQPIANVQVHVLDAQGQHVPIGVPGELYIGGSGLARGYVNQPELTAARFVPDPFSGEPGARLYKTGDRVRILLSGELEFLGRFDSQVKLRGFRIELGEIETVLGQHPGVNEVAVVVHGESAAGQQIVAYVIPQSGTRLSSAALKDFLRARLPDFMVPAAFVLMERFPVTPAGKVDRRSLPAPDAARPAVVHRAAPSGDLEQAIASIWREVLQTDEVGADDNFFDIGGTSLLIARVHARLSAIRPSAISIVDMFQFPTVRALAARLAEGVAPDTEVVAAMSEADAARSGQQTAGALRLREQARRRRAGAEARTAE